LVSDIVIADFSYLTSCKDKYEICMVATGGIEPPSPKL